MIRFALALELDYDVAHPGCDFIFNIHAAHTERQHVIDEALTLSQDVRPRVETDPATRNRYLRVQALPGPLRLAYSATVTCCTTSPSRPGSRRLQSRACPRRC